MQKLIKKNAGTKFLFLLLVITIVFTTSYNDNKKKVNENFKDVVSNIYFQKTIKHIFNNLEPRYRNINHQISSGETFYKILKSYSISKNEIIKIKDNLNSDYNLNNLKTNLDIKFTVDEVNDKIITSFIFPISKIKKIELSRNLKTNLFEKK